MLATAAAVCEVLCHSCQEAREQVNRSPCLCCVGVGWTSSASAAPPEAACPPPPIIICFLSFHGGSQGCPAPRDLGLAVIALASVSLPHSGLCRKLEMESCGSSLAV